MSDLKFWARLIQEAEDIEALEAEMDTPLSPELIKLRGELVPELKKVRDMILQRELEDAAVVPDREYDC